ncbi:hypothetical protein D9758_016285 [Tetrapyrgos nigripes]|uniref:Uncharacterized protein n=1 Tax=Tetrapyrgos nigripes TaxID=182062 RepID=A0A8H5FI96_9AGAR|nr:hypothetical protein D9758_018024 [Tetrapyrgos nigripes]KAF5337796.1 hypothetical protein D9758_016285 [Tetrapyrgos nigripes]
MGFDVDVVQQVTDLVQPSRILEIKETRIKDKAARYRASGSQRVALVLCR